jgi:SAM-dependent methyltransferase
VETTACDLCGSTRQTVIYQTPDRRYFPDELFTVVECDECGLGFVNPRPSAAEMGKYYPSDYYEKSFAENREYHQKRYAREARYLREIEERGGQYRLLDVGCANGDFPRFMAKRGWRVEGVEVSSSSRPIRDFPVYAEAFPDIPIDTSTYDAVTAWAVLEHVHHPMTYFQKAARVLKPGGLFVFLVTNFDSLASRHLFCEDVPRHLFFFTRETVRQYLGQAGLSLEREDNGREIFSMSPENWLLYFLRSGLLRRKLAWQDLPPGRLQYFRQGNLHPGPVSSFRYAMKYPLRVVDRAFWPVLERVQILRGTYGISTFVAHRS